jgi:Ca2+-binding EF-hand superfamily protein
VDNSGTISTKELSNALRLAGEPVREASEWLGNIDADLDGEISYLEFLASTMSQKIFSDERILRRAFAELDENEDGQISLDELKKVIESHHWSQFHDVNIILDRLSKTTTVTSSTMKDKGISYEAFMKIMESEVRGLMGDVLLSDSHLRRFTSSSPREHSPVRVGRSFR